MDLISVIVPVYNVEAYLDKCISSIVNQTYRNLEIILVDDGSPDNCPAMCDAWAKKDSRIRVFHQNNQGGGAARNTGLEVASGSLIAFVDSDDYIAPDMYMHLYKLLELGADIAECGYVEVTDDDAPFTYEYETQAYSVMEALEEHIHDRIFRQLIWNKLYRRKVLDGVQFPVGKKIDDEFFTYQALGNASTLIHSTRVCYAYRQQSESVMHSTPIIERLQAVEAKTRRQAYLTEHMPELAPEGARDLLFTCLYHGQQVCKALRGAEKKQAMRFLRETIKTYPIPKTAQQQESRTHRVWLFGARHWFEFVCRLRNMIHVGV